MPLKDVPRYHAGGRSAFGEKLKNFGYGFVKIPHQIRRIYLAFSLCLATKF